MGKFDTFFMGAMLGAILGIIVHSLVIAGVIWTIKLKIE